MDTIRFTEQELDTTPSFSASHEFDAELRLITEYKEKTQDAKSSMSRDYYQKKLNKQIKRVMGILAVLESGNPSIEAIEAKINE